MTADLPPPRPRNWIERNWKWAAPAGCVFVLLVMAAFAMLILSLIVGAVRKSDAYRSGVARAQASSEVQHALGAPVEPGFFTSGSIHISDERGTADIRIPLHGSRGDGTLRVVGERAGGRWYYSEVSVRPEGGGSVIDLRTEDEKGAS